MKVFQWLAFAPALAMAAKLTVYIPPGGNILPNPATLPASTHAVLIGPPGVHYKAPLRTSSTFVFDNLEPASYLLTIHAHEYAFPPLRVDVTKTAEAEESITAWQTFRGNEWSNVGPQFGTEIDSLSIHVRPIATKEFYQARGGFNLLSFLKSPMILMGLFSVVMIFGMPYLMDSMDPETRAEFEAAQKSSPFSGSAGAASQLQNFDLAGFLSGKASGSDAVSPAAGATEPVARKR